MSIALPSFSYGIYYNFSILNLSQFEILCTSEYQVRYHGQSQFGLSPV